MGTAKGEVPRRARAGFARSAADAGQGASASPWVSPAALEQACRSCREASGRPGRGRYLRSEVPKQRRSSMFFSCSVSLLMAATVRSASRGFCGGRVRGAIRRSRMDSAGDHADERASHRQRQAAERWPGLRYGFKAEAYQSLPDLIGRICIGEQFAIGASRPKSRSRPGIRPERWRASRGAFCGSQNNGTGMSARAWCRDWVPARAGA
jgi:hypothetical protein